VTGDEIIRGLVRRAHDADPERVEVDFTAGLSDVRRRVRPRDTAGGQDLTLREREILDVIRDWVERFGYPPSLRALANAVGLTSTSSVTYRLRALERKGYLRRDPNRPRAIGTPRGDTDAVPDPQSQPGRPRHNN
jgi:repressor LexA